MYYPMVMGYYPVMGAPVAPQAPAAPMAPPGVMQAPLSPFAQKVQTIANQIFARITAENGLPLDVSQFGPEHYAIERLALRRQIRMMIGDGIKKQQQVRQQLQQMQQRGQQQQYPSPPVGVPGAAYPQPGASYPSETYSQQGEYWPEMSSYDDPWATPEFGRRGFGRPARRQAPRWNTVPVNRGFAVAHAPDRQIARIDLGGGLHVMGEIHPAVAGNCSPTEMGVALSDAIAKALMDTSFGADGQHWTEALGACPCSGDWEKK